MMKRCVFIESYRYCSFCYITPVSRFVK
uniref:Uncharacterized protein n=1 Tax=Anguilla anguilla TaxID=7936 RepID=A0A0E9QCH8_ANGAN